MKSTSFGLSMSPASGSVAYNSASRLSMKVEKSFGLVCISMTCRTLTYPLPFASRRIKSSTSKEGSPKKLSAPCCSSSTILRRMVPTDADERLPYSASIASLPSPVMNLSTSFTSLRSSSGRPFSSQYLNITVKMPCCVSLS